MGRESQAKLERRYLKPFERVAKKHSMKLLAKARELCVSHKDHAHLNRNLRQAIARAEAARTEVTDGR
jgi:hypothetical protein